MTERETSNKSSTARLEGIAIEFVDRLGKLDNGKLAALKRAAGKNIAEASGAMQAFYSAYPFQLGKENEEGLFLVATAFGSCKKLSRIDGGFGLTARAARNSSSMDRRFSALIESKMETGELAHRLIQFVRIAASKSIGINWKQLALDVMEWNQRNKKVQKQWARDYYGTMPKEEKETTPAQAGIGDNDVD